MLIGAAVGLLAIAAGHFLPPGVDWHLTQRPAALAVWAGRSPYAAGVGYANAPWAVLPLLPLALLPEALGRGLLFMLTLGALAYTALRLGAKPLALAAFLASPPVINELLNGNNNWLVLLGFTFPPTIGLFFLLVKPQVGSMVAVFWLVEAWRTGGWRAAVRVFAPATLALAASFALFGFWPLQGLGVYAISQSWNASLWPASLPVGLVLLVAALRRRDPRYAMAAAPCVSPYVLFHAWSGALVALASQPIEMLAAVVGLWGLVLLRVVGAR